MVIPKQSIYVFFVDRWRPLQDTVNVHSHATSERFNQVHCVPTESPCSIEIIQIEKPNNNRLMCNRHGSYNVAIDMFLSIAEQTQVD
jgi:hypothetical protein